VPGAGASTDKRVSEGRPPPRPPTRLRPAAAQGYCPRVSTVRTKRRRVRIEPEAKNPRPILDGLPAASARLGRPVWPRGSKSGEKAASAMPAVGNRRTRTGVAVPKRASAASRAEIPVPDKRPTGTRATDTMLTRGRPTRPSGDAAKSRGRRWCAEPVVTRAPIAGRARVTSAGPRCRWPSRPERGPSIVTCNGGTTRIASSAPKGARGAEGDVGGSGGDDRKPQPSALIRFDEG